MKRSTRRVVLACAIALLPVGLLAHGLRGNPRAVPSPLIGAAAPEFTLPRFGGGDLRPEDLRGHVRVVNFWASWCVPCREEAGALEAAWRRYRDSGVMLIGVNIQDRDQSARGFLAATRPSYPNVIDGSGAISISYGIYGVPETFVIDRQGRIRARQVGAVTVEALAREIEPLLRGGS
jgi:cytochrome c biogenesis protein CcmG, thiol:disulfide interchange protein DsbE